ncbi:MAG: alpha/beta hydrolase [Saccharofermentanales bacterium]
MLEEALRREEPGDGGKNYFNDHVKPFFMQGGTPEQCILIIHGFTGSPAGVRPLAEFLNRQGEGYNVCCMILPEHGTSMDDLLKSSWKKWYSAAAAEFRRLSGIYQKVSVIGLSMGGNIALCLAASMNVHRIVTISTPIIIKNKLGYIAEFLSLFRKYQLWRNTPPLEGELKFNYEIGYPGMPVRSIAEVRKITIASFNRLHRIRQPILIAQSVKDRTTHARSPYMIYDLISSEYKELLLLMDARHNAILSPEREKLFQAIELFLGREIHPRDLTAKD